MLRLIETYHAVKIEVELMHPDIGSDFKTYVLEDDDRMTDEIKARKWVLKKIASQYKDSYWHDMNVRFLYIFDNEVYTIEYKEVSFYDEIDELFNDDTDDFEDSDMDDFGEMMPCDYTGYCSGMNCRNYMNCKG